MYVHSTVSRSIASIHDLSSIDATALHTSVNKVPQVVHIGYGPPYYTISYSYLFTMEPHVNRTIIPVKHGYC